MSVFNEQLTITQSTQEEDDSWTKHEGPVALARCAPQEILDLYVFGEAEVETILDENGSAKKEDLIDAINRTNWPMKDNPVRLEKAVRSYIEREQTDQTFVYLNDHRSTDLLTQVLVKELNDLNNQ